MTLSLLWKISLCSDGIQEHKNVEGGRNKGTKSTTKQARLFWKSIVKTKHQSLTSLAFIPLVPGADRAVHHICIRCILHIISLLTGDMNSINWNLASLLLCGFIAQLLDIAPGTERCNSPCSLDFDVFFLSDYN